MGKLKVYYGWSRIGNVRKKRALSVMFENDAQGCRSDRGQRCLRTIQDTIFERYQTNEEEKEGKIGLYRILKDKQTSQLIKKYETRSMYKACKVAVQFLISKGVSEENKLKEAQDMIEKYRRRYNIKEE